MISQINIKSDYYEHTHWKAMLKKADEITDSLRERFSDKRQFTILDIDVKFPLSTVLGYTRHVDVTALIQKWT